MTEDRNDKSLCEKSMKMVVNIIKLSSFSIAKMSLGAIGHPAATKNLTPPTDSDMVTDELLQTQFSRIQMSEKLQNSSKTCSFLMQPGGGDESLMVHEEKREDDVIFAAYIKKIVMYDPEPRNFTHVPCCLESPRFFLVLTSITPCLAVHIILQAIVLFDPLDLTVLSIKNSSQVENGVDVGGPVLSTKSHSQVENGADVGADMGFMASL
ncbi:hypothetical protein REPUB_Repub07fG0071100 [Reevesia pubescens]